TPNAPAIAVAPRPRLADAPEPAPEPAPAPRRARRWRWIIGGLVLSVALIAGVPWLIRSWGTVSTDDAYVNGHVTIVAPRISGQVTRVLVDDNNRVHRGDLLVQLDKEPYQLQVDIAQAAVAAAQADLVTAQADVRAIEGK